MTRYLAILSAVLFLAAAVLWLAGCNGAQKKRAADAQKKQAALEKGQRLEASNLAVTAQEWKDEGDNEESLRKMLSENPTNAPVPPGALPIVNAITKQHGLVGSGIGNADKMITANRKAATDALSAKDGEIKSLTDARDGPLYGWTMIGLLLGGAMIVGGVLVAMIGKRYSSIPFLGEASQYLSAGTDVAAAGWLLFGLSLGLRLGMAAVTPHLRVAGLTIVCCISVFAVYMTWRTINRIRLRDMAEKMQCAAVEIVTTAQKVENRTDTPAGVVAQEAAGTQSQATQEIVRKIKEQLPPEATVPSTSIS